MRTAIYLASTGKISRFASCPPDHIAIQCQEGEEFYLNCPPDATHIINNAPVVIPPEPPTEVELFAKLRSKRNAKLTATDWTQLPDAPVDKSAWATYRQALRDLPETVDINNPVWPTPP